MQSLLDEVDDDDVSGDDADGIQKINKEIHIVFYICLFIYPTILGIINGDVRGYGRA